MSRIKITAGEVTAFAKLNDSSTAKHILDALPLTGNGARWGQEIYFSIPVKIRDVKHSVSVVEKGDLAYWPPGSAFCIFWGPTPASHGDEIRAASAVSVFGRLEGDPTVFESVGSSVEVLVERA